MATSQAPVIIKKKKIVKGGGHHGGAWKVAYADFVTAMMAFFLLMWLLNATTEEQRRGLADYFNPSVPIARVSGGGSDALQGSSILSDEDLALNGASDRTTSPLPPALQVKQLSSDDRDDLERVQKEIAQRQRATDDPSLADHIQIRMTQDGLVIELIDRDGSPLFDIGSANPSPLLKKLFLVVAPVLSTIENPIEIIGHTDSLAYSSDARYSNWELSADRATTARRLLIENGLLRGQISAVIGKADVEPISPDRYASQNRRIAILLRTLSAPPGATAVGDSLTAETYNQR